MQLHRFITSEVSIIDYKLTVSLSLIMRRGEGLHASPVLELKMAGVRTKQLLAEWSLKYSLPNSV